MMTRRALLMLSGAAVVAAGASVPLARPAMADALSDATAFVSSAGDRLSAVVNGPAPDSQKRAQLTAIIDQIVDVQDVARFCLGRFWRQATPQQQAEYTDLFHRVLVDNITGKVGEYRGVTFTIGRAQPREGAIAVSSLVKRPNNEPNRVEWLVSNASGGWRIIDVIAEGTSLRLTQRNDYTSYLAHNNNDVHALIDAMRKQAAGAG